MVARLIFAPPGVPTHIPLAHHRGSPRLGTVGVSQLRTVRGVLLPEHRDRTVVRLVAEVPANIPVVESVRDSVIQVFVDLLANVAVAAITATIATIYLRVYLPLRVRRFVWRMDTGFRTQPKILIDNIAGEHTGLYIRPSTGYGAAVGTSLVINSLNSSQARLISRLAKGIHVPPDVVFASDLQVARWKYDSNLVVIGGPKNNIVCREILQKIGCQETWPGDERLGRITHNCISTNTRVGVAIEENKIWWYGNGYIGDVSSNSLENPHFSTYSGTDYGVILRIANPFADSESNQRAVLLFGSQTFGVIGAARGLIQFSEAKSRRSDVGRLMQRHENMALLVSVDVDRGQISPPRILDHHVLAKRMPPNQR